MQTYDIQLSNRSLRSTSADRTLVRTSIGVDRVRIYSSEGEWTSYDLHACLKNGDTLVSTSLTPSATSDGWEAYMAVPQSITAQAGQIGVTVYGFGQDGEYIVTEAARNLLTVEAEGDGIGPSTGSQLFASAGPEPRFAAVLYNAEGEESTLDLQGEACDFDLRSTQGGTTPRAIIIDSSRRDIALDFRSVSYGMKYGTVASTDLVTRNGALDFDWITSETSSVLNKIITFTGEARYAVIKLNDLDKGRAVGQFSLPRLLRVYEDATDGGTYTYNEDFSEVTVRWNYSSTARGFILRLNEKKDIAFSGTPTDATVYCGTCKSTATMSDLASSSSTKWIKRSSVTRLDNGPTVERSYVSAGDKIGFRIVGSRDGGVYEGVEITATVRVY